MIKIADWLKVSDFETSRWRRNFYEVEIPDIVDADTPTWTNYFEENKVLTRSEIEKILNKLLKRKTQWVERVKNAIDYDLKDWEKIDGRAMVFNLRAWLW
jgi:AAA+ ATPase superfamily predicted ATPase